MASSLDMLKVGQSALYNIKVVKGCLSNSGRCQLKMLFIFTSSTSTLQNTTYVVNFELCRVRLKCSSTLSRPTTFSAFTFRPSVTNLLF